MVQFGHPATVKAGLPEVLQDTVEVYQCTELHERVEHRASTPVFLVASVCVGCMRWRPMKPDLRKAWIVMLHLWSSRTTSCFGRKCWSLSTIWTYQWSVNFETTQTLLDVPQRLVCGLQSFNQLPNHTWRIAWHCVQGAGRLASAVCWRFAKESSLTRFGTKRWKKLQHGALIGPIPLDDILLDFPLSRRYPTGVEDAVHWRLLQVISQCQCSDVWESKASYDRCFRCDVCAFDGTIFWEWQMGWTDLWSHWCLSAMRRETLISKVFTFFGPAVCSCLDSGCVPYLLGQSDLYTPFWGFRTAFGIYRSRSSGSWLRTILKTSFLCHLVRRLLQSHPVSTCASSFWVGHLLSQATKPRSSALSSMRWEFLWMS